MGMLLRHRPSSDNTTTTASLGQPKEKKESPVVKESVKDEKPRTVKRGRPTKQ